MVPMSRIRGYPIYFDMFIIEISIQNIFSYKYFVIIFLQPSDKIVQGNYFFSVTTKVSFIRDFFLFDFDQ